MSLIDDSIAINSNFCRVCGQEVDVLFVGHCEQCNTSLAEEIVCKQSLDPLDGQVSQSVDTGSQEVVNQSIAMCCICLEGLGEEEVALNCRHRFHTLCIIGWLSESMSCPICRWKVDTKERYNVLFVKPRIVLDLRVKTQVQVLIKKFEHMTGQ